jgi:hypothetical protein
VKAILNESRPEKENMNMRQITLASLADTTVSPFSPTAEVSPRQRPAASAPATRYSTRAVASSTSVESDPVLLPSSPIAERFCGALGVSALLGFGSATLSAHGAAADSALALGLGFCGMLGAVVLQLVERRRVKILLTEAALERGLDPDSARRDARERLRLWLS